MDAKEINDIAFECLKPLAGKCDPALIFQVIKNISDVILDLSFDENIECKILTNGGKDENRGKSNNFIQP